VLILMLELKVEGVGRRGLGPGNSGKGNRL
jgi:hypothetical protein